MKKTIFALVATATALIATPALAGDFTGPRAELSAGWDDVTKSTDRNDLTYGGAIGVDVGLTKGVTVGVEANADNVFDKNRTIGAAARLGFQISDNALVYGKVGYSNYRDVFSRKLDGLAVGGGVDVKVAGPFYAGAEYAYHDFEGGVGRHAVKAKVGIRF